MSSRTIRLRRPATLSVQEGVFVPPGNVLDEVNRRWDALCKSNPAYFDGRLYHVLGVHRNGHGGAVLHVIDCAYRFHAVQDEQFDVGMRALGLKGVTSRGDEYLMGRRSEHVAGYKGLWEFAPAGSMEPGESPATIILKELHEETGLQTASEPVGIAVLYDPVLRCWELVFRLEVSDAAPCLHTGEYSELAWRQLDDLPSGGGGEGVLSPIALQIAELLKLTDDRNSSRSSNLPA